MSAFAVPSDERASPQGATTTVDHGEFTATTYLAGLISWLSAGRRPRRSSAGSHCWWAVLCRGDPHQVLKFTGRAACDHRLRLLVTRQARREITAQRPTAWLG